MCNPLFLGWKCKRSSREYSANLEGEKNLDIHSVDIWIEMKWWYILIFQNLIVVHYWILNVAKFSPLWYHQPTELDVHKHLAVILSSRKNFWCYICRSTNSWFWSRMQQGWLYIKFKLVRNIQPDKRERERRRRRR